MKELVDEIIFRKKLRDIGNVLGFSLPVPLQEFLEVKQNDVLCMASRIGKSGKGVCIWKQKDGENNEPKDLS